MHSWPPRVLPLPLATIQEWKDLVRLGWMFFFSSYAIEERGWGQKAATASEFNLHVDTWAETQDSPGRGDTRSDNYCPVQSSWELGFRVCILAKLFTLLFEMLSFEICRVHSIVVSPTEVAVPREHCSVAPERQLDVHQPKWAPWWWWSDAADGRRDQELQWKIIPPSELRVMWLLFIRILSLTQVQD